MRRLYYIADDLPTTRAISETLHEEGVKDWNFHVVAKDESGLYQHHIHSATPIHQLDIIHSGERWGLLGAGAGLVVGLGIYFFEAFPFATTGLTVFLFALVGGLFGAWQGGVIGMSRESYKLEPFHEDIEAGRYLIMVDVKPDSRGRVREVMNMGFPKVRFCGRDTTMINPFSRPKRIFSQITHIESPSA
jgi:hypothetical protein